MLVAVAVGINQSWGSVAHSPAVLILTVTEELRQESAHCLSNQGFDGGQRGQLEKARDLVSWLRSMHRNLKQRRR